MVIIIAIIIFFFLRGVTDEQIDTQQSIIDLHSYDLEIDFSCTYDDTNYIVESLIENKGRHLLERILVRFGDDVRVVENIDLEKYESRIYCFDGLSSNDNKLEIIPMVFFEDVWESLLWFSKTRECSIGPVSCEPGPQLSVPGEIDFGDVLFDGFETLPLVLANTGMEALVIDSISDDPSDEFEYTLPSLPATVPSGSDLVIDITFSPGSVDIFPYDVEIISDDPNSPTIVSLIGEGVTEIVQYGCTDPEANNYEEGVLVCDETSHPIECGGSLDPYCCCEYYLEGLDADIVLALDTSASLSGEIQDLIDASIDLVNWLSLSEDHAWLGLVKFESEATILSDLSYNSGDLLTIINGLTTGGSTYTGEGLLFSTDLLNSSVLGSLDRPDTEHPDYIVVVTDGIPTFPTENDPVPYDCDYVDPLCQCYDPPQEWGANPVPFVYACDVATQAKNVMGIEIFTIAVGGSLGVADEFLRDYIASPQDGELEYAYTIEDYGALQAVFAQLSGGG